MPNTHEQKFFNALRDVFVGARIEGESGFINLMRIKSRYFTEGILPKLTETIASELTPFPTFREELFDKLYSFFKRYFSESGSIYFRHTPYYQDIYERVYTDDRDVLLFWKTQNLYYVKTDRLFRSLTLSLEDTSGREFAFDGSAVVKQAFAFDASSLQNRRNNEKRTLLFEYKGKADDETLRFTVQYNEGGRKTKTEEILKAIRTDGVALGEEQLTRAFRLFERQTEVDFFINKNARVFLEEQFDLWMYQYLFKRESEWTDKRIRELQALKRVARSIIEFISQFEDELVRIWNKPKFALRSNYIITFDRVFAKSPEVARKLLAHENINAQIEEWRELGMIDGQFTLERIFLRDEAIAPKTKKERAAQSETLSFDEGASAPESAATEVADSLPELSARYRFLPFDTKHFKSLELELLSLFDNLDEELDGRLIHSENYQALNTLKDKFREKVKCIHIDPPYNTATSGFEYENTYKHASWLSMMGNRIEASLDLMSEDGSFLCHIDENEYERLHLLFEQTSLPNAGTLIWDKKNPMLGRRGIATQHEYIVFRSYYENPIYLSTTNSKMITDAAKSFIEKNGGVNDRARREFASWLAKQEDLSGGEKAYKLIDEDGQVYRGVAMGAPEQRTDPKFFKPLIHPVTKKPCPVPAVGWSRTPEKIKELIEKNEILFGRDETVQPQRKVYLNQDSQRQISSVIQEARKGKTDVIALGLEFPYCHPVSLYETLLGTTLSKDSDATFDFFGGSGTTAHAVINLNRADGGRRKYLLVEVNEYFHTVILPRIKKVVFSDKWKDGAARADGAGASHFCKYFALEQYEDTLRRALYLNDSETGQPAFFDNPYESPFASYVFLRDKKMADALAVDYENNKISVDFSKLYEEIDLAETLSCVRGKFIKSLTAESVTFADGEIVKFAELDYRDVLPLIWWDK